MIYPSITSISGQYRQKIREAEKLHLKEICLFLTTLKLEEREKLYRLLKKTHFQKFPLIHLRHDMELWELDFLVNELPSVVFNIHPLSEYSFPDYFLKYKNKIYLENAFLFPDKPITPQSFPADYAGICLDISHLEDNRLVYPKIYEEIISLVDRRKLGCAHVGPMLKNPLIDPQTKNKTFETHLISNLSEFDYLKKMPAKFFPEIIALEVENSINEQLEAIKYLREIVPTRLSL